MTRASRSGRGAIGWPLVFLLALACGPEIYVIEAPTIVPKPVSISLDDGWDAPPGSGAVFVLNQIGIADQGRGFDLDGRCDGGGCIDNALWRIGELGNDQIRQHLLGGEALFLVEIAGLDRPYQGDDPEVTVKLYGAKDADEPFFPANNFKVPPGHTSCCELLIKAESLEGSPPQARSRLRAKIQGGRLSTAVPGPMLWPQTSTTGLGFGVAFELERAQISAQIPSALDEVNEGLLGGAVPISTLARTTNPFCKTVSPRCPIQFGDSTLIDLTSTLFGPHPDVDLDGDGDECVYDSDGDGLIDVCCDRTPVACDAARCLGWDVPPADRTDPRSCVRSPEIADGYSIAMTWTAVRAKVVGVGTSVTR